MMREPWGLAGELLAVVLLLLPWFVLRRWTLGRWAMIALHSYAALAVVVSRETPYYPPEDYPPAVMLFGLPAVLLLAARDRRKRREAE